MAHPCSRHFLSSHSCERSPSFLYAAAFDHELVMETLHKLKQGLPCRIPRYDFKTSSRLEEWQEIPHAHVIILEGILTFFDKGCRDLMDIKIFVDTDPDIRLARRIRRDITERGRDLLQVLEQYERHVKPSYDEYIAPTKVYADIVIPRGGTNKVAIDIITKHIKLKLQEFDMDRPDTQ